MLSNAQLRLCLIFIMLVFEIVQNIARLLQIMKEFLQVFGKIKIKVFFQNVFIVLRSRLEKKVTNSQLSIITSGLRTVSRGCKLDDAIHFYEDE